jgi:hypothetical protein
MRPPSAALLVFFVLGLVASSGLACGASTPDPESTGAQASPAETALPASVERVRRAVLRGAAKDFAQGTGIGGAGFESCLLGLLGGALDRATITRLVQVYRRPGGQRYAAQALNALASALGARCGHRPYVPELIEASRGLREGTPAGRAARALGVTYGPYLGVRCRRAYHVGCDRIGIDIVFSDPATRVLAVVGGRRLRLHTPGMHGGARYRDWVGTLRNVGLDHPRSRLHVRGYGRSGSVWAGKPPVYVPVELRVAFADGRNTAATFPGVFLSPGWG